MSEVQIETDRLILRQPRIEDLPRWTELVGDPDATRYMGGVQTPNQAWRSMMSMAGAWQLTGVSMFALEEKASGRWIGRCGPWNPAHWPAPEVGWALHPDASGQGYATEAAQAALRYAFETLGWERVIHVIDPDNTPSIRVAERIGSRLLGPCQIPAPFESVTCSMWGQTREEWVARQAGAQGRGHRA